MSTKITDLKPGQHVRATGRDTRGHTVTREGYLVLDPQLKTATWDGTRTKVYRLHVDPEPGAAEATRQNWVSLLPDWTVELLDQILEPAGTAESSSEPVPLVGLAGAARSGKDTAAEALLSSGWQRKAFAGKVKDMLYALDPVMAEKEYAEGVTSLRYEVDGYGWETTKEVYPEVRPYLQRLGTEGGRAVLGENVWVDALLRDRETWGPTVITDVRFPNEADAIRAHGGLVLLVERPGQEPITHAGHTSENALAGYAFDGVIRNDGTVWDLYASVREAIKAGSVNMEHFC
ncbi:hypothetical protein [Streptomyces antarcticus]|uniref:deoxynucleotide monophosphate kinase family protein n=1 Tax=Streptomyces antarcticus TaxID=2996458 RepID=UPI00226EDAEB|nr:hypothetical protein [Streptomyces sp. H34-AA3]MCY0946801.1 hypothetical protein [Streptomyces sp. H34-AA3]